MATSISIGGLKSAAHSSPLATQVSSLIINRAGSAVWHYLLLLQNKWDNNYVCKSCSAYFFQIRFEHFFSSNLQSILADFSKEQEAFIKEKEGKGNGTAVPPWSGCSNEASLKEQCLALSTVRIWINFALNHYRMVCLENVCDFIVLTHERLFIYRIRKILLEVHQLELILNLNMKFRTPLLWPR